MIICVLTDHSLFEPFLCARAFARRVCSRERALRPLHTRHSGMSALCEALIAIHRPRMFPRLLFYKLRLTDASMPSVRVVGLASKVWSLGCVAGLLGIAVVCARAMCRGLRSEVRVLCSRAALIAEHQGWSFRVCCTSAVDVVLKSSHFCFEHTWPNKCLGI